MNGISSPLTDARTRQLHLVDRSGRAREVSCSAATVYSESHKGRLVGDARFVPQAASLHSAISLVGGEVAYLSANDVYRLPSINGALRKGGTEVSSRNRVSALSPVRHSQADGVVPFCSRATWATSINSCTTG